MTTLETTGRTATALRPASGLLLSSQLVFNIGFYAVVPFLALVMTLSIRAARAAGFSVEDEIVVAFCGTQKGLAAGVPMAALLFPPAAVGLMVLPLMIYHQLQLTACAVMAGRYARRAEDV